MRPLTSLLLALLLSACASRPGDAEPPPPPDPGTAAPVTLSPGESAEIDGLKLTFTGVDGDNRCPRDVQCIVGGQALVRIRAEASGEGSSELRIPVPPGAETTARYAGYEIVVDLEPETTAGESIEPGDYLATIRVARKPDEESRARR